MGMLRLQFGSHGACVLGGLARVTGRLRFGALGNPHGREQREPVLSGRTNFAGPPNRGVSPDCRRRAQSSEATN